jgi:tripartite-type tricarboxylate transporter receptor subunit TctC
MSQDFNARRRDCLALAAAGFAGMLPGVAGAQSAAWPTKPVTVVVPFPPGGGTDTFARPLSAQLTRLSGQQFLIDNRGGAGGNLGATIAARAAADGYTMFLGGAHHTIAPSFYPKLDYSLTNDFVPLALVSSVPIVIVVNPQKVAATNLKELIAYLKANPGKLSYGSAGNGSAHHMAGELFKGITNTFITHIPYRGAGPALQELVGGQIEMMFDGLGSSAQHIKSGRLRAIAVAGERRAPGFPDIPTTTEAGLPEYKTAVWYGMWTNKATPKDIQEHMIVELKKALATKEIVTAWAGIGAEPATLSGPAFNDFVNSEIKRWGEVVRSRGIKME